MAYKGLTIATVQLKMQVVRVRHSERPPIRKLSFTSWSMQEIVLVFCYVAFTFSVLSSSHFMPNPFPGLNPEKRPYRMAG